MGKAVKLLCEELENLLHHILTNDLGYLQLWRKQQTKTVGPLMEATSLMRDHPSSDATSCETLPFTV